MYSDETKVFQKKTVFLSSLSSLYLWSKSFFNPGFTLKYSMTFFFFKIWQIESFRNRHKFHINCFDSASYLLSIKWTEKMMIRYVSMIGHRWNSVVERVIKFNTNDIKWNSLTKMTNITGSIRRFFFRKCFFWKSRRLDLNNNTTSTKQIKIRVIINSIQSRDNQVFRDLSDREYFFSISRNSYHIFKMDNSKKTKLNF